MTPTKFGVEWPREPSRDQEVLVYHTEYDLSKFENFSILTPNDPKNPQSWRHPDFPLFCRNFKAKTRRMS